MEENINIKSMFNRVKNLVYTQKYETYKLTEIALLIKKEQKTTEDLKLLKDIYGYVKTIAEATEDLGTKLIEISDTESDEFIGVNNLQKIEEHVRNIVLYIDMYIDALVALQNAYTYEKTRFILKRASSYLKAIRSNFLKKSNEFKIKIIKNPREETNFKMLISDILTIFVQEAFSLRIIVLKEKLEEVLRENG